jgi:aspartyl-tRNA(Asn)/glutamyl-tRNA(Gln) amidotransferase subunit A
MALAWTMDKLGPMCRSAADCGLVLAAIAGFDPADPTSVDAPFSFHPGGTRLEGLRVGWLREDFAKGGEPDVEPLYRDALDVLLKHGAEVTEAKLPDYPHGTVAGMVISAEGGAAFEKLIRSGQVDELVDAEQRENLRRALEMPAADYLKAMRIRRLIQEAVTQLFESFDLLVAPSLLFVANPIEKNLNEVFRGSAGLGAVGNLCGLPGLSLPMGFGPGNLPVGLALVGRPFDEATVLRVGCAYQQVTDWHTRRPPIS